jgi:hypothetical protein
VFLEIVTVAQLTVIEAVCELFPVSEAFSLVAVAEAVLDRVPQFAELVEDVTWTWKLEPAVRVDPPP